MVAGRAYPVVDGRHLDVEVGPGQTKRALKVLKEVALEAAVVLRRLRV